jgi:hypothetical protein
VINVGFGLWQVRGAAFKGEENKYNVSFLKPELYTGAGQTPKKEALVKTRAVVLT